MSLEASILIALTRHMRILYIVSFSCTRRSKTKQTKTKQQNTTLDTAKYSTLNSKQKQRITLSKKFHYPIEKWHTSNTQIHDRSLSCLRAATFIKSGEVKLVLMAKTFSLIEMMRSCFLVKGVKARSTTLEVLIENISFLNLTNASNLVSLFSLSRYIAYKLSKREGWGL